MYYFLLRWIYAIFVFRLFLLSRGKVCAFSFAFLYVRIRTNQTVTYWAKVFRKNFFVKEYSSIFKYLSYQSYKKFLNIIFINITVYSRPDIRAADKMTQDIKAKRHKSTICTNIFVLRKIIM